MKKKISLLLCIFVMSLCFVGCSGAKNEKGYDAEKLEESAELIISNFAQMSEEDFATWESLSDYELNYYLLLSNVSASGEDFVAMIKSWRAAEDECGEYISHGEYEIEVKSDEVVLSTLAQYADREATISFCFDEDSNMESMDVSAHYSMGEILKKAGLNTVLGMGTVFVVLIFLAFLIYLMKYIPTLMDLVGGRAKKDVPEIDKKEIITPVVTEIVETVDDLELIAVITAAIAAQEGTSTDGFVVRSIRRRPSNNWN